MKTITAHVNIGSFSIETQVDPATGTHYVTSVFSNALLSFDARQDHASRTLKTLLGKDLNLAKVQAENTKVQTSAMPLLAFERLLAVLDRKGNTVAQEVRDTLVGLSLHQLSCDAHNIRFEAKQRQAWLQERAQHKQQFHPLFTGWLKCDGIETGLEYAKEVNRLKSAAGLPLLPVASYSTEDLAALNRAEIRYDCLRLMGASHTHALQFLRGKA